MPRKIAGLIGAGSVGLSFLLAAAICIEFLSADASSFQKTLWVWMQVGSLEPGFSF